MHSYSKTGDRNTGHVGFKFNNIIIVIAYYQLCYILRTDFNTVCASYTRECSRLTCARYIDRCVRFIMGFVIR